VSSAGLFSVALVVVLFKKIKRPDVIRLAALSVFGLSSRVLLTPAITRLAPLLRQGSIILAKIVQHSKPIFFKRISKN
jgi:hypothetical protein